MKPFLVVVNNGCAYTSSDTMHYVSVYALRDLPDIEAVLEEKAGLIVSGGPQHIPRIEEYPELQPALRLLGAAIRRGMTVLGICLGFQLLNYYYGNAVVTLDCPHIGCGYLETVAPKSEMPDRVKALDFALLRNALSFHYDGVLENCSPDLRVLARDRCGHVYMVAHRELPVYGIQSHPEATRRSIAKCFAQYGIGHGTDIPVPDDDTLQAIRTHFFSVLLGAPYAGGL